MWWRKRYCETCSQEVAAYAAQVQVDGVPYHFACYPSAQAPDVTRLVRVRRNIYRAEYLAVEWPDAILDTTVAAAVAERIWAEVGNPRLVRRGRHEMARYRREHLAARRRPHHPRWLVPPAAH